MTAPQRLDVHIDGLTRYDGFDAAARRAIERDNALSLLPRLHQRVVPGEV